MELVEEYVDGNMMQRRMIKDVVEEFSDELSMMRGKCLDIGSGPGSTIKEILLPHLANDVHIVGADISQRMTDYARSKYANDERLSFITLNIEAELPDNEIEQYDNAVSFFCLHWCDNMRRTFENIYKLLRPGGKALVEFLACHQGFDAYIALQKVQRYEPYMQDALRYLPYFQRYVKNARTHLRQILEEIGFEILYCSKREINYTYDNREIFRKHVIAVNPFVSRMPKDMKNDFINDLTNEILRHNGQQEQERGEQRDTIKDKYHILLAHVRKPRSII